MLDDLYDMFWQTTCLRHFLVPCVQNGPVGFNKNNILKKQHIHCTMIILC